MIIFISLSLLEVYRKTEQIKIENHVDILSANMLKVLGFRKLMFALAHLHITEEVLKTDIHQVPKI